MTMKEEMEVAEGMVVHDAMGSHLALVPCLDPAELRSTVE
jgi:hypothetical protein